MALSDIARALGLQKSTVHRILSTFESKGIVERDAEGKSYALGWCLFKWASRIKEEMHLVPLVRPYLQSLSQRLGESTFLVVRKGTEGLVLDKTEVDSLLRVSPEVGLTTPLYCTAVGRVLLAYAPDRDEVLETLALKRFTSKTICNKEDLRKALDAIKAQGYCYLKDEWMEGVHCFAAPIFSSQGHLMASISATAPTIRLPKKVQKEVISALLETARAISLKL